MLGKKPDIYKAQRNKDAQAITEGYKKVGDMMLMTAFNCEYVNNPDCLVIDMNADVVPDYTPPSILKNIVRRTNVFYSCDDGGVKANFMATRIVSVYRKL